MGKSVWWVSWGSCLSLLLGASLLRGNVVNQVRVRYTGRRRPICSFYIKTNIVIPTCVSDDCPPSLPTLVYDLSNELRVVGRVLIAAGWQQCCSQAWDRQLVGILP